MGRKKRRNADARIFCYYCERDFSSEHELVHHQKEKHLRCPTCHKRMVSTSGLVVHAQQVHKRAVTVPNAIEGREDPGVDVFGMQGVPEAALNPTKPKRPRAQDALNAALIPAPFVPGPAPVIAYPFAAPSAAPLAGPYVQPPNAAPFYARPHVPAAAPARTPPVSGAPPARLPPFVAPTTPGWLSGGRASVQRGPVMGATAPPARTGGVTWQSGRPQQQQGGAASSVSAALAAPAAPVPARTPAVVQSAAAVPVVAAKVAKKEVVAVFSRTDMSIEEVRAQLPRYRGFLKEDDGPTDGPGL